MRFKKQKQMFSEIALFISLALPMMACQTLDTEEPNSEAIRSTELALVRLSLNQGKPAHAIHQLKTYMLKNKKDPSAYNLKGLALMQMKRPDSAIKQFRKSYKISPNPQTSLNLSAALIDAKKYKTAVKIIRRQLKRKDLLSYPYPERFKHNLGYAYSMAKSYKRAIFWFRQAIEDNPSFYPAHLELARNYEFKKRWKLAKGSYQIAMDYCHVCFDPVYALSKLYLKTHDPDGAKKIVLKYVRQKNLRPGDRNKAERLLRRVLAAKQVSPSRIVR